MSSTTSLYSCTITCKYSSTRIFVNSKDEKRNERQRTNNLCNLLAGIM